MEFGYWGIKGLAEPIRWLIAYLHLDVKQENFTSMEEWFGNKKAAIGGDFPNLPYLVDGDYKLSESSAIPGYLINKAGKTELLGKDFKDQAIVRQIEGVLADIRNNTGKVVYGAASEEAAKAEIIKVFDQAGATITKINQLSKFLGTKEYLLGYLTYADFLMAYTMEGLVSICKSLDVDCPVCKQENLCAHLKRITQLDGVKATYDSRKAIPFTAPNMIKFKRLTTAEVEEKMAAK